MQETYVTFVVNFHDPDRMNQPDMTRHFATEEGARRWINDDLSKIAPKAHSVKLTRITTRKEVLLDAR